MKKKKIVNLLKNKNESVRWVFSYPDDEGFMVHVGITTLPNIALFGHLLLKDAPDDGSFSYYVAPVEEFEKLGEGYEIGQIFLGQAED